MGRLPAKPRDELNHDQQVLHDQFAEVANVAFGPSGKIFHWENKHGAQIGPMPFYMADPPTGAAMFQLLAALKAIPFPFDARETTKLTVGSHMQAGYAMYSDGALAIAEGLLSEYQVETIKRGEKPEGMNEGCGVSYDVAKRLMSTPGPLPQELWDRAVAVLGVHGTVGLVNYVGFCSYVSIFMNAIDSHVPGT